MLRELASQSDASIVEDLVATRLFGSASQPATIGRFRVLELVGSGGMGTVYAAHDPELDRKVAIKVVRGTPAASEAAEQAQSRLVREARVLARLTHPNVVALHEVGLHDEQVFLVMEFIEGVRLDEWLATRSRPWLEVLELFLAVGEGLAAAHALGIVHRDFKPANVLVDRQDRPRVVDFGLARPVDARAIAGHDAASGRTFEYSITASGWVGGTPGYMAPELFTGAKATPQTDAYAFCIALLEALSAAPSADPDDAVERDEAPGELISPLLRGIAADPEARWPGMQPLLEALRDAARRGRQHTSPRPRAWVWIGVATLAAGALALALSRL